MGVHASISCSPSQVLVFSTATRNNYQKTSNKSKKEEIMRDGKGNIYELLSPVGNVLMGRTISVLLSKTKVNDVNLHII